MNLPRLLLVTLLFSLLAACAGVFPAATPSPAPTETPARSATPAVCQPSPLQTSKNQFPEVQGTLLNGEGELWALLFFDKAHAGEQLKIVWRMRGTGGPFTVSASQDNGSPVSPTWGPELHGGSTWERPGDEWGTGFVLPTAGCWRLTASLGSGTRGEIRLEVLPAP